VNKNGVYFTLKSINVEESEELVSILWQEDDVLTTSNSVLLVWLLQLQLLPQLLTEERSASLIASTKKSVILI